MINAISRRQGDLLYVAGDRFIGHFQTAHVYGISPNGQTAYKYSCYVAATFFTSWQKYLSRHDLKEIIRTPRTFRWQGKPVHHPVKRGKKVEGRFFTKEEMLKNTETRTIGKNPRAYQDCRSAALAVFRQCKNFKEFNERTGRGRDWYNDFKRITGKSCERSSHAKLVSRLKKRMAAK